MKLGESLEIYAKPKKKVKAVGAAPTTGSSLVNSRRYRTVSTRYGVVPGNAGTAKVEPGGTRDGRIINEYKTREEAERAAQARPFTKMVEGPMPEDDTPRLRDLARRRLVRTNPDVDAAKRRK